MGAHAGQRVNAVMRRGAPTFPPLSLCGDYDVRLDRPNAYCVHNSAMHGQCQNDAQDCNDEGSRDASSLL